MNDSRIISIDFVTLFEQVCASTTKTELVKAFSDSGLVNHTKMTGETKRGKDQYITLKDDKGRSTHLLIQKNSMRLFTYDYISNDDYFAKYSFIDIHNDGARTKAAGKISKCVEEFKFILTYFLNYDINWK